MEIERFDLALSRPLSTADGTIHNREGFLIRLEHEGRRGLGEATPLPGWTESLEECRAALSRAAEVAEELDWGIALAKTEAPAARHGLALALSVARARERGEALYRYLGGVGVVRSVPVNATVGDAPPAETAAAAASAVEEGVDCLKLKVGARELEADRERLRAVRERVGEEVSLRADANGAWTRAGATEALEAFEPFDLEYVEQPLPPEDLSGHAGLRGGPIDIALDESLCEHGHEEILAREAADVLVVKPMVVGGPDRVRSVVGASREAGVDPVVTTTVDAVVARTGAVHAAASIPEVRPCGLATASMLGEDLFADPAPVVDGRIEVPQDKGLGLPDRPAR